jgi:hypothetical protein
MTATKKPPHRAVEPVNPPAVEIRRLLLASEKFLNWKPEPERGPVDDLGTSAIMAEKHYTPQELAESGASACRPFARFFKTKTVY